MSLIDKKSLYDRHTRMNLGNKVGEGFSGNNWAGSGVSNTDAIYYANALQGFTQSPFDSPTGDHLVDLMTDKVYSANHGYAGGSITYHPSPGAPMHNQFADLNTEVDSDHSGAVPIAGLGQFGGPYIDNCPPGGFC